MKSSIFRIFVGLVVTGVVAYQLTADGPTTSSVPSIAMPADSTTPGHHDGHKKDHQKDNPPAASASTSPSSPANKLPSSPAPTSSPVTPPSSPAVQPTPSPAPSQISPVSKPALPASPTPAVASTPPAQSAQSAVQISTDLEDFSESIKKLNGKPQEIDKLLDTHKAKIAGISDPTRIQTIKDSLLQQKANQQAELDRANQRYAVLSKQSLLTKEQEADSKVQLQAIETATTILAQLAKLLDDPKLK